MELPYPKPRKASRDKSYMAAVRTLPCLGITVDPKHVCRTPIDAAHVGQHHSNLKADDNTTVPLCHELHMQEENLAGPWKRFKKTDLERWRAWAIQDTRKRIALAQLEEE